MTGNFIVFMCSYIFGISRSDACIEVRGHKVKVAGTKSVFVCVWALTFECLDLLTSFLVPRHTLVISRSRSWGQVHMRVTKYVHMGDAFK